MTMTVVFRRSVIGLWIAAVLAGAGPLAAIEKVGTTSMQLLKIPVGVRGIALGNAMVSEARDVEAVWWNPGALTEMTGRQLLISQVNMPAEVHLNSFAVAMRLREYEAVSLHAINLFTDDMPVRTWERPEGTGEYFNAWDLVVGAGYCRRLTDRFSLGGNVRYLHSRLENESYDGMAVDLGTLYKTGLRSMRLGMAIQNLGPDVKYSGKFADFRNLVANDSVLLEREYEGASLPTMFRLGIAFDVFEMFALCKPAEWGARFSVEMNHPNDNRERLNLGGEAVFREMLYLRAGGKFAYDEESFTLGFGLRIPVFHEYRFRLDYAYSHWGRFSEAADGLLEQPHRMAVGLEW